MKKRITAVTLPKSTVGRRSASTILENRAPILAEFLVGRRLFCRSTNVKSSVDRSADFYGFCHRWNVGRWSPDDRPAVGRCFEEIYIMISAEGRPIIGRQSADDRKTVDQWSLIQESSADRRRYRPLFDRWSPDCRRSSNVVCVIFFIMHVSTSCKKFNHALMLFLDAIHWTNIIWSFCCWISNCFIRMTFRNYVGTSSKKIET